MRSLCSGIELGSTRIKTAAINENHIPAFSRYCTWKSTCENGSWTYDQAEARKGLNAALERIENRKNSVICSLIFLTPFPIIRYLILAVYGDGVAISVRFLHRSSDIE